jgi:adenylate kinase
VIGLVQEKLNEAGCANGFVLDGFPRTTPQADELGRVLRGKQLPLDRVVNFEVSREAIIKRLSGRRSCPKCQATYHVDFAPSKKDGVCDRCGEALVQRSDDRREAIETRLKVYEDQTAPLIRYYGEKQLLSRLDASDSVDAVFAKLTKVLEPYRET